MKIKHLSVHSALAQIVAASDDWKAEAFVDTLNAISEGVSTDALRPSRLDDDLHVRAVDKCKPLRI